MALEPLSNGKSVNPKPLSFGIRGPITLAFVGFGWIAPYVFLRRLFCMLEAGPSDTCCQRCNIAHHNLLIFEGAIAHNRTSFAITFFIVVTTFIGTSVFSAAFRRLIKQVITAENVDKLQYASKYWSKTVKAVRYVVGLLVIFGILINLFAILSLYMNSPIWDDFYQTRVSNAMFLEAYVWFLFSGSILIYIGLLYFGFVREER